MARGVERSRTAVHAAIDAGINVIDTHRGLVHTVQMIYNILGLPDNEREWLHAHRRTRNYDDPDAPE